MKELVTPIASVPLATLLMVQLFTKLRRFAIEVCLSRVLMEEEGVASIGVTMLPA